MSLFQPATKKKQKARLALTGPSGSGKTYTALLIAKALGQRIAVIDAENGSASKYSGDVAVFDTVKLTSFAPATYIDALVAAAAEGYDVAVIDSLSHAWFAEGGILDQKDRGTGGFSDWKKLTPQQNALVQAILSSPCHVIATMRTKTEYAVEKDDKGKNVPRKIGLAPVQREGIEYEFDVIGEMDVDNVLRVTKSRCPALNDLSIRRPGADVGKKLLAWLDDGVDVVQTREKLVDCVNGPEVQAWVTRHAGALGKLTGDRRTEAQRAVGEAAARTGIPDREILAVACLLDAEPIGAAPPEALQWMNAETGEVFATPAEALTFSASMTAKLIESELAEVHTREEWAAWEGGPGEAAKTGSRAFVAVVDGLREKTRIRIFGVKPKNGTGT